MRVVTVWAVAESRKQAEADFVHSVHGIADHCFVRREAARLYLCDYLRDVPDSRLRVWPVRLTVDAGGVDLLGEATG